MTLRQAQEWHALCLGALIGVAGLVTPGCKGRTDAALQTACFVAEAPPVAVPKLPGWLRDPSIRADPNAPGGTIMRLVRESSVAGSPRIDVVLEPKHDRPSILDEFLTRNLREMAQLEQSGQMRIVHVEQRQVHVGSIPGWRVHHEYNLGTGAAQVSFNQVSTFFVLDGRGVAVTAAGRTELYRPVSEAIELILDGVTVHGDKPASPPPAPKIPAKLKGVPEGVQAVDLGQVGGTAANPNRILK